MKDSITSRLQLFLAKIAGRDVSESTLTPPVITSMEEKLLDEIADRMDAVEEAASSGGGGVITIDYDSLIQTQKTVDWIYSGDVIEDAHVFLYDIDPNSQYRIYMHDDSVSKSAFYLVFAMENGIVSECPDTEPESFELVQTISGEVPCYYLTCFDVGAICIVPTTTQFKTYKRDTSPGSIN